MSGALKGSMNILITLMVCGTSTISSCCATAAQVVRPDTDETVTRVAQLVATDWTSLRETDVLHVWPTTGCRRQVITATRDCEVVAVMCGNTTNGTCPRCETFTLADKVHVNDGICDRTLESVEVFRTVSSYKDAVAFANRIIHTVTDDVSQELRDDTNDAGPISIAWPPRKGGAPRSLRIFFTRHDESWIVSLRIA
jgi:hypothetical protein